MAQTSALGNPFAVIGKSLVLVQEPCRISTGCRYPRSHSDRKQVVRPLPTPFHSLISQMGLTADGPLELSFVHLLLKSAEYAPRSWTHRTPAREVLPRFRKFDGSAYRRLAFLLNEQVEKETR